MRLHICLVLATTLVAASVPGAQALDFSKVTCHDFLASGQANMASMFMFLRGYHAGKTGIIAFDSKDPYPGRLGKYCRDHPGAKLIEASEQILTELGQGI
jgi:HdeA/HdeB family